MNPAVYILTNKTNGVLYVGVTSDLVKRISQHKEKIIKGFATKYNCNTLVYFEQHHTMENAILREKQLKAGSRGRKIKLIESLNPDWDDLYMRLL